MLLHKAKSIILIVGQHLKIIVTMLKQTQGDRQGRTVIKRDTQSDEPL